MKQLRRIIPAVVLPELLLAGCGAGSSSISPVSFPKDTQEILSLFGDVAFFNCSIDPSLDAGQVEVWTCQDGIWTSRIIADNFSNEGISRIGLNFEKETGELTVFLINETATVTIPVSDVPYRNTIAYASAPLNEKVSVVSGQEITLYACLGYESGQWTGSQLTDFHNSGCDDGVAVTITFDELSPE